MDGSVPESLYKGKNQGDMLNVVQVQRGKSVEINAARDELLTAFGKATLEDRYLMPDETPQDLFARVASYFADDDAHAQRIYDYMSRLADLKTGQKVKVTINRDDDEMELILEL